VTADNEPADVNVILRALTSRTRREILAMIWDRELAAGEISGAFDLTAATISGHLAVLRAAGLVQMTKVGTSRRYRAKQESLAGLDGALEDSDKWRPAADIPERALTLTATRPVVIASVDLPIGAEVAFAALTDARIYSRWLEVPVTIEGNRFAATLEWGIEVRGQYELVVAPELIVMSWDFEHGNIPVPGHPLTGYLRLFGYGDASRVVVHQLVDTAEQARFMEGAWAMVLGRLRRNITAVSAGSAPPLRHPAGGPVTHAASPNRPDEHGDDRA
jgi:DNA-binding transcriptional ArsR family regulator